MEQVNILNKMAEFDFRAPINVTILEDSDDDSKTFNDASSYKNTGNVGHAELENVATKYKAQCLETARDENNTLEKHRTAERNIMNYDEVNNNNNLQPNSYLTGESRKRKLENPEKRYSVETIVDKYEKLIHAHQQKSSEVNTNGTQRLIQSINSEEPAYTCQQRNQCEEINNNESRSLEKLSENLILIMDSYYQMQTQLRSIKDATIRNKCRNAFSCIHRHFLDLSHDMIHALIVPQEKNTTFINSFLENTVRIANNKRGIKCDKRHVYLFYKNMLHWTKLQTERINRLHKQNSTCTNQLYSTDTNTCLKQYLNKPPMQLNIPAHGTVPNAINRTDNSCIFSSGPPGREITISINPSDTFETQTCNSMQKGNEYSNNFTPVTNTNNNVESFGYSQPPGQTVSANHYQARSNYLAQNVYHQRPPPPTYSMRQQNNYQNTNCYLQPMTTQLPTQNQVDTTRSTESSESGYVSPSYGSPNTNQMDCVRTEERAPFTPVISNIVSLSPRSPYTTTHGCHMCGKVTELWCSGCYTLYCSAFCEQLDSQFHNAVCRERSTWTKRNKEYY